MKFTITTLLVLITTSKAFAQTPFFNGGAVASDPIISVATDGVSLNVQRAVVSQDRKYVTLDMAPQTTSLGGFRNFTFQRAGLGFVGSPAAQAAVHAQRSTVFAPSPKPATLTPSIATTPGAVGQTNAIAPSVLDKVGLTCISSD
jgi:hypothetical protein